MLSARNLAALNAASFTGSQIALVPLFPFLAERTGLSLAHILTAFSVGSALFLWGSPYWAQASDSAGRARILLFGTLGLAGSLAILMGLALSRPLPSTLSLTALILSRVLYGLLASAVVPVAQAWQSDEHAGDQQNAAMARHSLALSAGRFLSLTAVVALADHPVLILLTLVLLAIWLVVFNGQHARRGNVPIAKRSSAARSPGPALSLAWPIFALAFCFTGSVELVNSSLGGTLQTIFQLDAAAAARFVGQLLLGASAVVLATQAIARGLLKRSWRAPLSLGLLSLLSGCTLLVGAGSREQIWIALALISIALGLIPPSYLSALAGSEASRAGRGRAAGLLSSTQTLGYAAGAGLAAWSFHFAAGDRGPALFSIVAASMVVGAVLLLRQPAKEAQR